MLFPLQEAKPRKITNDTTKVYYECPCFSPDASQIVYSVPSTDNNRNEIDIIPTLGGKSRKLVSDGDLPVWSPDGKYIAFFSADAKELFVVNPDGTEKKKVTEFTNPGFFNLAWSPDSRRLAFLRNFETTTNWPIHGNLFAHVG